MKFSLELVFSQNTVSTPDYANGVTIAEYWAKYNKKGGLANTIDGYTTYAFYTIPFDGFLYCYAEANENGLYNSRAPFYDSLNVFVQVDSSQDETKRNSDNLPYGYMPFWEQFFCVSTDNPDLVQINTTTQPVKKGDRIAVDYQYGYPPAQWRIILYPVKPTKY